MSNEAYQWLKLEHTGCKISVLAPSAVDNTCSTSRTTPLLFVPFIRSRTILPYLWCYIQSSNPKKVTSKILWNMHRWVLNGRRWMTTKRFSHTFSPKMPLRLRNLRPFKNYIQITGIDVIVIWWRDYILYSYKKNKERKIYYSIDMDGV